MATQAKVTEGFATVNGLRIHYLDWGDQKAMPMVLLHGLRSFAHDWDGVSREFSDRYRVIAVDQRGRGDSDWDPELNYHTRSYVSDLEQLVDQLGLERFVLIGHSMGGANTMVYASQHPDRVVAAVVEDMGPRTAAPSTGGNRIARELENTPMEFASWAEAQAMWREQRPLISEEAMRLRLENTLKELPGGKITWKYDLRGIMKAMQDRDPARQVDLWPHVRGLHCPTLVLRGAMSDVLSGETAAEMAKANPNVRWAEVPNATHYIHDDNVEVFNKEVSRFLAEVT